MLREYNLFVDDFRRDILKVTAAKILISLFIVFALSACSEAKEEEYAETTLRVEKKGKVHETIVSSFTKDYYDLNELTGEFTKSVSDYNTSIGSEEIKLGDIKLKGSDVFVDLNFTGPSDYESFIGEKLFVGTIGEAYDNGYTMDVTLKGVENGDKISKVQIMGMPDKTIIILSEHVRVKTFRDIAYVSANVDVIGERDARVLSESDGLAYIVLE